MEYGLNESRGPCREGAETRGNLSTTALLKKFWSNTIKEAGGSQTPETVPADEC